jgi:hypothetical protein
MQSTQIKTRKPNVIGANMNDAMDKFFKELFTNTRALYVDDSELIGKEFHVSYCHEYKLDEGNPDWMDIQIPKDDLVGYMVANELNKWERLSVSNGEITNELIDQDAETCLMEMDSIDLNNLIRDYLEKKGAKA